MEKSKRIRKFKKWLKNFEHFSTFETKKKQIKFKGLNFRNSSWLTLKNTIHLKEKWAEPVIGSNPVNKTVVIKNFQLLSFYDPSPQIPKKHQKNILPSKMCKTRWLRQMNTSQNKILKKRRSRASHHLRYKNVWLWLPPNE